MSGDMDQNNPVIVDVVSDSDSDTDFFDFVAQYRKLEEKKRKEKLNPKIAVKTPPILINSTIATKIDPVIKITKSNITSASTSKTNTSEPTTANKGVSRLRSQNRKKRFDTSGPVIGPVICIGDFDDGYNMPPPKCFAPEVADGDIKSKELDEEDDYCYELLNRVMNIKVYWRQTRTHRFFIRMFQSIECIYEYFAKLENIKPSEVSLVLKKKTLTPADTPHSMNYKVVDFIDGDIEFYKSPYDTPETTTTEEEQEEEFTFRVKQKDVKHPVHISIKKSERMCILYLKLAEKLGLDVESFVLEFDGDRIKKSDTIERLELEGDECFDLFEKKK